MSEIQFIQLSKVLEIDNYRTEYPAYHIRALSENMAANGYDTAYPVKGVLLPDGNIKLIAGHCRTRAYKSIVPLTYHIPVIVVDETNPATLALLQLSENGNRRDPSAIDDANGYKSAMDKGATIEQVCTSTGKTKDYVQRRLDLLALLPEVQSLVASKQIGITFALALKGMDTNFQRIALKAYNSMKSPTFDEFNTVCSALLEKQNTCSLFDLSLFNGQPIENLMQVVKVEKPLSRAELIAALDKERKAKDTANRYGKILAARYDKLQAELATLRQQVAQAA